MILVILAALLAAAPQSDRGPELALAAADGGEFETFHNLAWRAMQTGPARDPTLMLMLARAQALSGRPHDALVMLDRLAQMGVPSDADTNDDFARTRQLPDWPEVAARIERLRTPATAPPPPAPPPPAAAPRRAARSATKAAPPAPAPKVEAPAPAPPPPPPAEPPPASPPPTPAAEPPPPAAPPPPVAPPAPVAPPPPPAAAPAPVAPVVPPVAKSEAVRFSTDRPGVVGLAYDLVSRRILFADRTGRKLVVVSEGSNHPLDLVRADSAGFKDISAIEIDDKRGDLWVTSAADENGAGTLHRLQLVSGRPLRSFRVPAAKTPVNLADVAITRGGTVLILDAASGTILQLRPGAAAIERVMHVDVTGPVSLAVGSEEGIAYLAHRDGVSRLDLRAGSASTMSAPKNASLAGLEQIRWYRTALIGISSEAGSTRIVRFDLNASERSVRRATTIEASAPLVAHAAVTISGDDLLYLSPVVAGATEFVAYRVHLK
jgi:hypothetical protein